MTWPRRARASSISGYMAVTSVPESSEIVSGVPVRIERRSVSGTFFTVVVAHGFTGERWGPRGSVSHSTATVWRMIERAGVHS